jgi:DNA repair protein SbcD/Mre11
VRILHTSDWHLGRSFHREGLLAAQACFVDSLLETIASERVDLVVVSGDVYDRALPPVDAVALADDTFARLASSRAGVVVTSGNHDSARRLGFNSRLIDASGVYFRTDASSCGAPVLLEDRHGPVAVYGLPYLEPDVLREPWRLEARSHTAVLTEAMRRVAADLAGRPTGTRSVVLAHAFVAGAGSSDSERDISVGGVAVVPPSVFDGVDYAALGHLHGRHRLTDSVRYSGSPLAYSFSEADHVKGSWLVELGADGLERADFVAAPVPRRLAKLRGRLEDLLAEPRHSDAEGCWLQVVLTDPVRPVQAMDRLRSRFPHTLALAFEPEGGSRPGTPMSIPRAGASDHDVALAFFTDVRGTPATAAEATLLQTACDACREDAEADQVVSL